ncbi:MAG: DUF4845 domain-containing protein [Chromatiales bacterium]|jgi:hypothetical protein|nr:DUF4845 domain-containing protein [Chromatiales bacterium]
MRSKQQGITAIAMAIILSMFALIAYAGFMVIPIYMETTKVDVILDDVKAEYEGKPVNIGSIRSSIGKRLNIEAVNGLKATDFVIKKKNRNIQVGVTYQKDVRYIGDLYLLVKYDNMVELSQ